MIILKINTKRWLNGSEKSMLYRSEDRKMCCLGFLARKCGAKVNEIERIYKPGDERKDKGTLIEWEWPPGFIDNEGNPTSDCTLLMYINDMVYYDASVDFNDI